jgi:hypothetical protein
LKIENPDEIVYIERAVPEWRNWQTRWTQNPVPGDRGEGSIPSSGMPYFPLFSIILACSDPSFVFQS